MSKELGIKPGKVHQLKKRKRQDECMNEEYKDVLEILKILEQVEEVKKLAKEVKKEKENKEKLQVSCSMLSNILQKSCEIKDKCVGFVKEKLGLECYNPDLPCLGDSESPYNLATKIVDNFLKRYPHLGTGSSGQGIRKTKKRRKKRRRKTTKRRKRKSKKKRKSSYKKRRTRSK